MLTGIHFLLTYTCNFECDHCFVYSSPKAKGTFTLNQIIKEALDELIKIETIEWVYFEGGEPFMFYLLILEGTKLAQNRGFKTGVVTNAYWATSEEDAELWLRPLCKLGISDLSISDDAFHIDLSGYVHLCQGLVMGNMLEIPLSKLVKNYDADSHPICGPLLKGGPALLAKKYKKSRMI